VVVEVVVDVGLLDDGDHEGAQGQQETFVLEEPEESGGIEVVEDKCDQKQIPEDVEQIEAYRHIVEV